MPTTFFGFLLCTEPLWGADNDKSSPQAPFDIGAIDPYSTTSAHHDGADFIEGKALPGTGLRPEKLWQGLADIILEAARALVVEGVAQPSGYTEPLLHKFRWDKKAEG
jgi:hypothetical protein